MSLVGGATPVWFSSSLSSLPSAFLFFPERSGGPAHKCDHYNYYDSVFAYVIPGARELGRSDVFMRCTSSFRLTKGPWIVIGITNEHHTLL